MKIRSLYVIDDDKIYHFLLKNLLKQNKIDVKSSFFQNGQDAIDFMSSRTDVNDLPDLILLDVNMPIMNGWQFLEEYIKVKDNFDKLPTAIYMISSSNNEVDINKAREFTGVVKDYFLKPICREDLDKIFI